MSSKNTISASGSSGGSPRAPAPRGSHESMKSQMLAFSMSDAGRPRLRKKCSTKSSIPIGADAGSSDTRTPLPGAGKNQPQKKL